MLHFYILEVHKPQIKMKKKKKKTHMHIAQGCSDFHLVQLYYQSTTHCNFLVPRGRRSAWLVCLATGPEK